MKRRQYCALLDVYFAMKHLHFIPCPRTRDFFIMMKRRILPLLLTLLLLAAGACAGPGTQGTANTQSSAIQTTIANGSNTAAAATVTDMKETSRVTSSPKDKGTDNSAQKSSTKAAATTAVSATTSKNLTTASAGRIPAPAKGTSTTASATAAYTTKAANRCTITVECKTILSNMSDLKPGHEKYVPKNGYILAPEARTFAAGDTVYDVLKAACSDHNVKLTASNTSFGIYVSGIGNIDEKDCGKQSGWLYSVNGTYPSVSCDKTTVSNGDSILFTYTCSY